MTDKDAKSLIEEMQSIKKLLVLQLLGSGIRQKQIALMLGISEATMSRMLPKGLLASSNSKPGTKDRITVMAEG